MMGKQCGNKIRKWGNFFITLYLSNFLRPNFSGKHGTSKILLTILLKSGLMQSLHPTESANQFIRVKEIEFYYTQEDVVFSMLSLL